MYLPHQAPLSQQAIFLPLIACPTFSYEWDHTVCSLVSGFFLLKFIRVVWVSVDDCFFII